MNDSWTCVRWKPSAGGGTYADRTVRERKDGEARVGLTPEGAFALAVHGHQVWVEHGAGKGSGHDDQAYVASGAQIVETADEVWGAADLLVKVKEPVESSMGYLRAGRGAVHLPPPCG